MSGHGSAPVAREAADADPRPLARRLEELELQALLPLSAERLAVAGGAALFGGPRSPVSKALGLELGAPPTDDELDALVAFFDRRGAEPRVELTAHAPAALVERLGSRGFLLRSTEHVLVRGLERLPAAEPPRGVEIGRVDPADAPALRAAIETSMGGFVGEGESSLAELVAFGLAGALRPTADTFVARADGVPCGAAGCDSASGVTALYGASVRPGWRGRGIQRALLAARLARARERGSALATIRSRAGEATERNARRIGFTLSHARVVLVRPGPPRPR